MRPPRFVLMFPKRDVSLDTYTLAADAAGAAVVARLEACRIPSRDLDGFNDTSMT